MIIPVITRLHSLKLDRVMARPTILRRDTHRHTIKVTIKGAIMAVVTIPVPGAAVVHASVAHGIAGAVVTACPGTVDVVAAAQALADRGTVEVVTVCPGTADAVAIVCRGIVEAVATVQASVARGIVEVVTTCHGRTITVGGWS